MNEITQRLKATRNRKPGNPGRRSGYWGDETLHRTFPGIDFAADVKSDDVQALVKSGPRHWIASTSREKGSVSICGVEKGTSRLDKHRKFRWTGRRKNVTCEACLAGLGGPLDG